MEKLEEEKSQAKLEMSKKLETIQVQKETGAAVSEEFQKQLVPEDKGSSNLAQSVTMQPKSDLQKLQDELTEATL